VLADERYHVSRASHPRQAGVEDEFRHSRGCLNFDLRDGRLWWEQHPKFQLFGGHLVGDGMSGLDEHFIGHALRVRGVDGHKEASVENALRLSSSLQAKNQGHNVSNERNWRLHALWACRVFHFGEIVR